ncbi:hypothetical protein Syn7502_01592 [Synechococcus sp. PCC 7502]|uniref:hypothetical protein n=1 Tax=Synechococcus sp. PCC 7502 TaxID=1173263 RepID=UPI00029FE20E|nr:hypothetical protein [Synechococcus sp. PCC 7502]AFY73652.1 hypothetical protein Syn7502_01592 [Synechococcus sp. PCC 7502]
MQNRRNITAFLTILFIIILVVILTEKFIAKSAKVRVPTPPKPPDSSPQSQPFTVPKVSNPEKKELVGTKTNQNSKKVSRGNELDLSSFQDDKSKERGKNNIGRSPEEKNPTCIVQLNQNAMQDYIVQDFIDRYECSTK